jgi:hypothetical protein
MQTIDLLIIGAGPAGLSLALHLLQQDPGWSERLVILEKAAHPRPKLCGGAVTRLGLGILQDLGFSLPLPIPQARVDDVRLVYAGRVVHVRGRPQLAIFHRAELDAFLAEQACRRGAVIRQNEPVTSFHVDEEGVTVMTLRSTRRGWWVMAQSGRHAQAINRFEKREPLACSKCSIHPRWPSHFSERFALFDFTPYGKSTGLLWDFLAVEDRQRSTGVCTTRASWPARADLRVAAIHLRSWEPQPGSSPGRTPDPLVQPAPAWRCADPGWRCGR